MPRGESVAAETLYRAQSGQCVSTSALLQSIPRLGLCLGDDLADLLVLTLQSPHILCLSAIGQYYAVGRRPTLCALSDRDDSDCGSVVPAGTLVTAATRH